MCFCKREKRRAVGLSHITVAARKLLSRVPHSDDRSANAALRRIYNPARLVWLQTPTHRLPLGSGELHPGSYCPPGQRHKDRSTNISWYLMSVIFTKKKKKGLQTTDTP